jgi:hypothetical protein
LKPGTAKNIEIPFTRKRLPSQYAPSHYFLLLNEIAPKCREIMEMTHVYQQHRMPFTACWKSAKNGYMNRVNEYESSP